MRPMPKRFELQSGSKCVRVERDITRRQWMLWLAHNGEFTEGTFLALTDDGNVSRVTWHPDGTETVHGNDS